MAGLDVESRGHLALLDAVPHEARVAARAERKRERIEQDGFAGAGFSGEHREAGREINVEPFDQDDVADREPGQHGKECPDSEVRKAVADPPNTNSGFAGTE